MVPFSARQNLVSPSQPASDLPSKICTKPVMSSGTGAAIMPPPRPPRPPRPAPRAPGCPAGGVCPPGPTCAAGAGVWACGVSAALVQKAPARVVRSRVDVTTRRRMESSGRASVGSSYTRRRGDEAARRRGGEATRSRGCEAAGLRAAWGPDRHVGVGTEGPPLRRSRHRTTTRWRGLWGCARPHGADGELRCGVILANGFSDLQFSSTRFCAGVRWLGANRPSRARSHLINAGEHRAGIYEMTSRVGPRPCE